MSRRFDVVFLDSGGTIFDPAATDPVSRDAAWAGRFERAAGAAAAVGWTGDARRLADLLGRLEPELEQQLGVAYGFDKLLIEAGRRIHPRISPEDALVCADAFAGPRYRTWLFPRAAENFRRLREEGVVLAVVANTAWPGWIMRRALSGVGLAGFLEVVVCSCDVGVPKPDRGIFEHAVRRVCGRGSKTGRFCHVGDSLECDVAGAKSMGWPVAFRRSAGLSSAGQADFEFNHWDELADWVLG